MHEVIQEARVSRGKYRCAMCGGENFGPKDVQRDHIHPVEDPHTGFTTWDNYIERLFCEVDGLQVLCKSCHLYKTDMERNIRKQTNSRQDPDEEL